MARALAGWEGENAMKLVDRLLLWVLSLLAVVLSLLLLLLIQVILILVAHRSGQLLTLSEIQRVAQLHIYPCIVEGFRLITLCVAHLIEHLGRIVHIIDVCAIVNHPVQKDACGISPPRHLVVHGQGDTRECRKVSYRVAVYQFSASFGILSLTQLNIVAQQVIEVALLMGYLI